MSDYSYQTHSAYKILADCQKTGTEAAVLAASPGSGKTTISHIVISRYLKQYPNAKVLVLTHGQNLLKNQYIESLQNPHVEVDYTFGEFGQDVQVQIGLPQAIKKYPYSSVDLLIVDECHEFYLKKMVQGIIKNLKPKHQVLMTGSPSEFNRLKKQGKKYEFTYISGNQLVSNNVFSNVVMEVVPVRSKKEISNIIVEMYSQAKRKGYDLSKLMVACKKISDANIIASYLRSIGRKVAVSNCKNDRTSSMVKDFKNGEYDTLIVIQRGILGFSDNDITGLIDMRCSPNVDISNQLFARVLRKHPKNIEKFYYRYGVKKTKDFNNQVIMLHKVKAMMRTDMLKNYDGTNMKVSMG